jgi:hypothetical protein
VVFAWERDPQRSHETILTRRRQVARSSLLAELWVYMRVRKKFWLLPILIVLLLVGFLLVFAQGSPLAPFIYTIF